MCVCDDLFVVTRSLEQNVKSFAVVRHQKIFMVYKSIEEPFLKSGTAPRHVTQPLFSGWLPQVGTILSGARYYMLELSYVIRHSTT